MVSHLFFYQLVLVALVWLCLMLQWAWPGASKSMPKLSPICGPMLASSDVVRL
jgi:hypothetical protein